MKKSNTIELVSELKLILVALLISTMFGNVAAQEKSEISKNVTKQIAIEGSGFRMDYRTGELVQSITITNKSSKKLVGALELILVGLDPSIKVKNASKKKLDVIPEVLSESVVLQIGENKELKPDEKRQHIIRFSVPENKKISYKPMVLNQVSDE